MPTFEPFLTETTLQNVKLTEQTEKTFTLPPSIESSVASIWNRLLSEQPTLHPSPLYRVTAQKQHELTVATDITYRDVVGIRNTEAFATHFTTVPLALSMIAFVKTSDQYTVLIERNTGDWPTSLELPGAFMRPAYGLDLYTQALTFLHNDLALTKTDISKHKVRGMLHNSDICEAMLVADFTTVLSLSDLKTRAPKPVHALPADYRTEHHNEHFSLPVHQPSKTVLELVDTIW